jgi:3-oxoacyl-[acyl-carrier-protein] synthase II
MRRVVVTGLGLLITVRHAGLSTAGKSSFPAAAQPVGSPSSRSTTSPARSRNVIPRGDGSNGSFNPEAVLEPKELRKVGDFILYGIAAADEALEGFRLEAKTRTSRMRPAS